MSKINCGKLKINGHSVELPPLVMGGLGDGEYDIWAEKVIEPETIEVGDWVRIKVGEWAGLEMEVFWADVNSDRVLLKLGRDLPHPEKIFDLTLIRKGPKKKTIQNVKFAFPLSQCFNEAMHLKCYFSDAIDTSKIYRMTLEETVGEYEDI